MSISSLSSISPYTNASYLMSKLSSSDETGTSEKFQSFSSTGTSSTGTTTGIGRAGMDDSTLQALFQGTSEGSSVQQPDFADMVSSMDADGDGAITQEEFISARPSDVTEEMAESLWSQFDTEDAGSLTTEELETAMASSAPPPPPPPSGGGMAGSSEEEDEETSSFVSSLDTDGDGYVSQAEFLAARPDDVTEEMAENLWSQFDTEGTGSLSVETLTTAMAKNKPSSSGGTSQLASAEEETYSALQELIDQLNETTSTAEAATTNTSSSSLTALQEFLSAIKSYQASAGYENTQNLMSSLMAMA